MPCAGGGALHREIVDDDAHVAPADLAVARELAVGLRLVGLLRIDARRAEQSGLEKGPGIEQIGDALARVPDARRGALRVLIRAAAGQRLGLPCLEFRQQTLVCHNALFFTPRRRLFSL